MAGHVDPDTLKLRIPPERFAFTFTRSGGPGGQNVNKVSSRVTLCFDLAGDPSLTDEEKWRIAGRLAGRISGEGILRVVSMRHRGQRANRVAAVERFYELLAGALTTRPVRRATRVPRAARRKRLVEKRQRGETKRLRGRSAPRDADG